MPPRRPDENGKYASVRGWRSFVGIPVSFANVQVTIAGRTHEVIADRGGVIDTVIEADLPSGWQKFTMSVEGQESIDATAFIVGDEVKFGVLSDVDDTVMVTALLAHSSPHGTPSSSTSMHAFPSRAWPCCSNNSCVSIPERP